MRIFLASSFSDQIDPQTKQVFVDYKVFTEYLLKGLREEVGEVFCALEHEKWQVGEEPPEIGLLRDIEEINASDCVVAMVNDKPSAGVQFELGYAVAKGKRVILARAADHQLSWFNQGTVGAGLVTHISFDTVATLLDQLVIAIKAPA